MLFSIWGRGIHYIILVDKSVLVNVCSLYKFDRRHRSRVPGMFLTVSPWVSSRFSSFILLQSFQSFGNLLKNSAF